MWQHSAGHVEQAKHIGGKQALGLARAGFFHRAQHAEPGVVDQYIDAAETLDPLRDRLMRFLFSGHVETHRLDVRKRVERLEVEKTEIMEQMKEVYAEAKGNGYDVKVLRKVVALRKRKPDDIAEEEAVLEMYKAALGMS